MRLCRCFSPPNTWDWIEDLNTDLVSCQCNIMKHTFGKKNAYNLWDGDEFQIPVLI